MDSKVKKAMEALGRENEQFPLSPLLRDRILASVKNAVQDAPSPGKKVKTRWLLIAAVLFVFSTGFASITWYEIRNKEGETVQEYQAAPPLSKERLAELQQRQKEMEQIQSKLQPGTAAAVYRVKEDGQDEFFYVERPLTLTKLEDLRSHAKNLPAYPDENFDSYTFAEASISYDYETDEAIREQLKQEARASNNNLIIHKVTSLASASHVSLTYEDPSGHQLRINFLKQFWSGKSKMIVPGVHEKVEEVRIGTMEGLYTERMDPFGKLGKELRWMDEGWSLSINGTDESITKEDFLKIAAKLQ